MNYEEYVTKNSEQLKNDYLMTFTTLELRAFILNNENVLSAFLLEKDNDYSWWVEEQYEWFQLEEGLKEDDED